MTTGSRTLFIPALLVALLLAPLAARAGDDVVSDEWYVVKLLGKPSGYTHEVITRGKLDGRVAYLSKREDRMAKENDGERAVDETSAETWTAEDGEFLKATSVDRDGTQEQRLVAERVGDRIRVRQELNETGRDTTVVVPAGTKVYDGIDGRLLVLLGLEPGKKHTVTTFSDETCALATETAEVVERRTVESLGRKVEAFVVRMTTSEMPGVVATALCDDEGRLLHVAAGPVEFIRATRDDALAAVSTGGLAESHTWLPLEGGVAAWPTLDSVVLEAAVDGIGDDETPPFPEDEYESVARIEGGFRLELHALPAPAKAAEKLPITPASADLAKYAAPALTIQSDAPEIKAEAERILAGEKDPLAATTKLCRAVFANLKKEKVAISAASALETLRAGMGDCTEHAVLFCALARAAGLPSREAYGITLRANEAGYHAWSEVLIDGRWVAVDATIGAVGLAPAYIRFGTTDGNGTGAEVAPMIRLFGRTKLVIVSATRRGTTFDPRDEKQRITREGDVRRDLGADYRIDLSGGWKLRRSNPPNTIFGSPSGEAIVVTVADAPVTTDADWTAFEQGFGASIGGELKLESKGEDRGRPTRTYTYEMNRDGKVLAGRIRVLLEGPVLYAVNAMSGGLGGQEALEKLLSRVKIGE